MEPLSQELRDIFGVLTGDMDADFLHYFHRNRVEVRGLGSPTKGIEVIASEMPQESLSHLATARGLRANEHHFLLDHGSPLRVLLTVAIAPYHSEK